MVAVANLPRLERLAPSSDYVTPRDIDWQTPIDRSRWFLCETLTPLYYTAIYPELPVECRLRYNQLTGMLTSELIALLESEFLASSLAVVRSVEAPGSPLRNAVERFAEDERRHADIWRRLNALSEPQWYARQPSHLVTLPRYAGALLRLVARHPIAFPVVFWVQLVQEERSVEISRRCMRMPAGSIEPRYAAAFAAHVKDEIRHVQIDRHLIERFYGPRPRTMRRFTGALFRVITEQFLLAPAASTRRAIALLVREYAQLLPLLPRIHRELRALAVDGRYHSMMYSRQTTPVTFALFDRFDEFHQMRHVLRSYHPEHRP